MALRVIKNSMGKTNRYTPVLKKEIPIKPKPKIKRRRPGNKKNNNTDLLEEFFKYGLY